jgi:hypothetical protein
MKVADAEKTCHFLENKKHLLVSVLIAQRGVANISTEYSLVEYQTQVKFNQTHEAGSFLRR